MITYKSEKEVKLMKESGKIAASILHEITEKAKPGVSTFELNEFAEQRIHDYDVKPAFKGVEGFPASLCTSVNEVIVHGVPDKEPLREGDILGLDFGVIYKGWYSDTAVTMPIGTPSHEARRTLKVCKKALKMGIKKAKPGNTTGDIGNTIQRYVEDEDFSIVKELVGHGVGRYIHEDPQVPNFGKRGKGIELKPGMVIAIEPMIIAGPSDITLHRDRFGYASSHKHLTAHFEDTVAITENGPEILTQT